MSNWKKYKLGEIITHKKGFAFKSKDYLRIGIPIVRVSDLTEDSIDLSSCLKISDEAAKGLEEYSLEPQDMVITTVGSWSHNPASVVGKVIKVPMQAKGALSQILQLGKL
jgi:type I restriction enzyme S subunit